MLSRQTYVRPPAGTESPPPAPQRALSIRQPWAWAILYAGKRVENRSWYTAYRGQIFIHAGLAVEYEALDGLREDILRVPEPRPPAVRGALLATANLVDCVRAEDVALDQYEWALGPWCLILDSIAPLASPIAYKGQLGLFPVRF